MSIRAPYSTNKPFRFVRCWFEEKLLKICDLASAEEWQNGCGDFISGHWSKLYKINLISFLTKFCKNKGPRMETLLCKMKIQKMYSLIVAHCIYWKCTFRRSLQHCAVKANHYNKHFGHTPMQEEKVWAVNKAFFILTWNFKLKPQLVPLGKSYQYKHIYRKVANTRSLAQI